MKPKPLQQTPSGINTACLIKFCLSESRAACQCQPCIELQEPWRKPVVFSTSPAFHPTTRSADNTHTLEPAVRRQRVRQLTLRNYARTGRTGRGQACPGGKPCCLPCCVHLPSWAETREVCLYPRRRKCGGGAGGKCRLSWGLSLDWHVSSLLPLCRAGGGGIDTPPGRSYSREACDSWCCSLRWRREARTPPMPVMPVARASRMPCPPACGSTPAGRYVYRREVSGVCGAPPSV